MLEKSWRDYALNQKKSGQDQRASTLMANEPESRSVQARSSSSTIVNKVQENYMRTRSRAYLAHLRRELGDPGLELEVNKAEVRETTLHGMDNSELMAEKNPALLTFAKFNGSWTWVRRKSVALLNYRLDWPLDTVDFCQHNINPISNWKHVEDQGEQARSGAGWR